MGKKSLDKRLSMLANLEMGNVFAFPVTVAVLHFSGKYTFSVLTISALIPTCVFLFIGSYFWYAKRAQLRRTPQNYKRKLSRLSNWEQAKYLLLITPITICVVLVSHVEIRKADMYMTLFLWCLGFAEWINYYHRQLMYFDNKADFIRLIKGKGMQVPWLRRELIAVGLR